MNKQKEPDFMMGLNVPINVPTKEEVELYTANKTRMEPFLVTLVEAGHLTNDEVAAYLKFMSEFSLFSPFILDSFLATYRSGVENMSRKPEQKSSRILTPDNKGKIVVPS